MYGKIRREKTNANKKTRTKRTSDELATREHTPTCTKKCYTTDVRNFMKRAYNTKDNRSIE